MKTAEPLESKIAPQLHSKLFRVNVSTAIKKSLIGEAKIDKTLYVFKHMHCEWALE